METVCSIDLTQGYSGPPPAAAEYGVRQTALLDIPEILRRETKMEPLSEELKQLNEDTFHAENKNRIGKKQEDWETFLRRVLADDFRISRASRVVQNKEEMIKQIQGDERMREGPADVGIVVEGDYGVVTSVVTVQDDPNKYHNLKLFNRQPSGEWQCVYWRVTRLLRQ